LSGGLSQGGAENPEGEYSRIKVEMNEMARTLGGVVERTNLIPKIKTELTEFKGKFDSINENVGSLSKEFEGFGEFRTRVEGYESTVKGWVKKGVVGFFGLIVAIIGSAYYVGGGVNGLKSDISDSKDSAKRLEVSVGKIETQIEKTDERQRASEKERMIAEGQLAASLIAMKTKLDGAPDASKLSEGIAKAISDGNKSIRQDIAEATKKSVVDLIQDPRFAEVITRPVRETVGLVRTIVSPVQYFLQLPKEAGTGDPGDWSGEGGGTE